tara:strand:+ start:8916 stop:9242 length:327 start_codon:yes stop_codon:yes gene_type:complete
MTTRPWRTEAEIAQSLIRNAPFTLTTSGDTAETAVTLVGRMEEGVKFSFVVETNDLYVAFDETATSSSMLVPAGTGFFDENVYIGSFISVINATAGSNGRIRGIVWGR